MAIPKFEQFLYPFLLQIRDKVSDRGSEVNPESWTQLKGPLEKDAYKNEDKWRNF